MQIVSLETIVLKCQLLFSRKRKEKCFKMSYAEFVNSMVSVNYLDRYMEKSLECFPSRLFNQNETVNKITLGLVLSDFMNI